jgi:ankyrin repeat protein
MIPLLKANLFNLKAMSNFYNASNKADVTELDIFKNTSAHVFTIVKKEEELHTCINKNDIGLDCKNIFGFTCLHIATLSKQKRLCKVLLDKGANINVFDKFNCTPLHILCLLLDDDLLEIFLQHNADSMVQDVYGCTPLHYCCMSNNKYALTKLINKKCIDVQDVYGNTALNIACQYGNMELALIIVDQGANISCKNIYSMSPEDVLSII